MSILLCVDPSPTAQAMAASLATTAGLEPRAANGEEDALSLLRGDQPCAAVIVGNQLEQGDGLRLIEGVRLLLHRISLPIIFVTTEQSAEIANAAMRSGATEVAHRNDLDLLSDLVTHFATPPIEPQMRGRVLLVEDSNAEAARVTQLCQLLGLEVDHCITAEEGLQRLEQRYDVLIVDVILAGAKNGIALLRELRQRELGGDNVPVLMVSGFDDAARRVEALRSGADDYLRKPFIAEELVWRVRRLLEYAAMRTACATRPGPLTENGNGRSLLTARETQICEAICTGATDKQIATDLGISFWTVRSHIQNIFGKLNVLNRRELMVKVRNQTE